MAEDAGASSSALDKLLLHLLGRVPAWRTLLEPEEIILVERRLAGESFQELAMSYGLSQQAIRSRLYGKGSGGRRRGGIAGRLRGRLILQSKGKAERLG